MDTQIGQRYGVCVCVFEVGLDLWQFELRLPCPSLTTRPRPILRTERLYIIWGYSVAMETVGVWPLGSYLIGPVRVMKALLSSVSTETSGGPNVATVAERNTLFFGRFEIV